MNQKVIFSATLSAPENNLGKNNSVVWEADTTLIICNDLNQLMSANPDDYLCVYIRDGENEQVIAVQRKRLSNFRVKSVNNVDVE